MVPDLNPSHFIISQLADLIGDHLIAGTMVMTQISPEQLPRVPESRLGLTEGLTFYEMKSGHDVSFLYTGYGFGTIWIQAWMLHTRYALDAWAKSLICMEG